MESSEVKGKKGEGRAGVLVCFAVKEEAVIFKRMSIGRSDREIFITGMGKKNSEREIRKWLVSSLAPPALVLTCGFAGALNPKLKLGEVLFDTDEGSGLAEGLQASGAKPAKFYCASRVAVTVAEKTELRHTTGADAVEMESEIIRAICREKKIPSATVRAISDVANEDMPMDFNAVMDENQAISFSKLALALAKSPGSIPRLMKLQLNARLAAEQMADVLQKLLSSRGG